MAVQRAWVTAERLREARATVREQRTRVGVLSFELRRVHHDSALALYFMQARYYKAAIGRFITMDPLRGAPQDSLSLHRYLYGENSPPNMIDPEGLKAFGSTCETKYYIDDCGRLVHYIEFTCNVKTRNVRFACLLCTDTCIKCLYTEIDRIKGSADEYCNYCRVLCMATGKCTVGVKLE